jgi:hypothetical protein
VDQVGMERVGLQAVWEALGHGTRNSPHSTSSLEDARVSRCVHNPLLGCHQLPLHSLTPVARFTSLLLLNTDKPFLCHLSDVCLYTSALARAHRCQHLYVVPHPHSHTQRTSWKAPGNVTSLVSVEAASSSTRCTAGRGAMLSLSPCTAKMGSVSSLYCAASGCGWG